MRLPRRDWYGRVRGMGRAPLALGHEFADVASGRGGRVVLDWTR
ncbi:hypothetical protein [Streptomyces sp. JW3]